MKNKRILSTQTKNNWLVVSGLIISGFIAALSGIYFLFLPVGGYQGGHNPMYGVTVLFERHTWEDLHTWGSIALIAIALIHIPLHWNWIVNMTKRTIKMATGKCKGINNRSKFNLAINTLIAVSFLVAGISGLYFLFFPGATHGSYTSSTVLLFSRGTWDLIHTWSGIIMITTVLLHFIIHWKWFTKVSKKVYLMAVQDITLSNYKSQPVSTNQ
jgi:hypothetical protein